MAALDASILEVEDFPVPPRVSAMDRWFDKQVEGTVFDVVRHIIVRVLKRAVYGRRHDDLSDRLVGAAARLRLVAPPEVEALMREAETLASKHRVGDPHLIKQWKPLRDRMRQEFKDALDGDGG